MSGVNRLKTFLRSVDYDELKKPRPAGGANREQARFMKWLTDEYSIDRSVSAQAGIYQLLCGVVASVEED